MHSILIALLLFSLPTATWAGETIRVALLENAAQVLVTSGEGFFVKTASGDLLSKHPITSADLRIQKGITLNRQETGEEALFFSPRRGGKIAINRQLYDGTIQIKKKNGGLLVINEIDIERYLQGVVPAEMPPDWEMEALKVQAVISRTYALYQRESRKGKEYDLVNTILGQVYKGESVEDSRASVAIAQTKGQILSYDGGLALTFFHSTSAGPTEDAAERWNMLHPAEKPRICYLEETLAGEQGLFIAASDYVRALPEQISRWVPGELYALGTDGMGRSETREALRRHFEVDAESIAIATLYRLHKTGQFDAAFVAQAIKDLNVDSEKVDPYFA